jgi:hypothetical protein
MDMARLEIPVSGWTCLRTEVEMSVHVSILKTRQEIDGRSRSSLELMSRCCWRDPMDRNNATWKLRYTFVDVGRVGLLARLCALLLVTSCCGLLASFLLLSGGLRGWGLAGGLLLCCGFGRHFGWKLKLWT